MKILITGARGFIGRHLARLCSSKGIEVYGLGHGAWTEVDRATFGVRNWLNGDVCQGNLDILSRIAGVPDIIFHLAGGSSVGPSLEAPLEDFRRTVVATSELLEWSRLHCNSARVILASSAAVYGIGHSRPIPTDGRCEPYSPYGTHKMMAEILLRGYCKDFGISGAVVRLFSVYGDGLRKQLLWDLCGKLSSGQGVVTLGGSGEERRDWLHVDDCARLMYEAAALATPSCPVLNGGTGRDTTVREIASLVCQTWGGDQAAQFSGAKRAGDPEVLVADHSDTVERLAWSPTIELNSGIESYVRWYKTVSSTGLL